MSVVCLRLSVGGENHWRIFDGEHPCCRVNERPAIQGSAVIIPRPHVGFQAKAIAFECVEVLHAAKFKEFSG